MSISPINLSNIIVSPPPERDFIKRNGVNFASRNYEPSEEKSSHKLLWGAVLLAAAATAGIFIHGRVKFTKLKAEITKTYDEIWKSVVKDIDETKIQIEKPKLKYLPSEDKSSLAGYTFQDNAISINFKVFKDRDYVIFNQTSAFTEDGYPLFSLADIEKLKRDGKIDGSWTIKKISDKEKMLNLAATIAHEQRHCVQLHMVLNDADYGVEHLNKVVANDIRKSNPNLSPEDLMRRVKQESPYLVKFKPKAKMRGLVLPSALVYDGKRVGISAKGFANDILGYTTEGRQYTMSSLEIDANAFAAKYLKEHPELKKDCDEKAVQIIVNTKGIISDQNVRDFLRENASRIH